MNIKNILKALGLATMCCIMATSCSEKKKADNNEVNHRYESIKEEISAKKKHNKAILLVTFGSSWEAPHNTYSKIEKRFAEKFSDYDVYFSFTSKICIKRCKNKNVGIFHRPEKWLEELAAAGYETIGVQSLHVIPGKEYTELSMNIEKFIEKSKEDGKNIHTTLTGPLLKEMEDIENLSNILHNRFKGVVEQGNIICFLGHGKPEKYSIGNGNTRYQEVEKNLQERNNRYYIGTVDMEGNQIEDMIKRMKDNGYYEGSVYCVPLLTVAGEHTMEDMTGGTNEEAEEDSWRYIFNKEGYDCKLEYCIREGLADNNEVIDMWIEQLGKELNK